MARRTSHAAPRSLSQEKVPCVRGFPSAAAPPPTSTNSTAADSPLVSADAWSGGQCSGRETSSSGSSRIKVVDVSRWMRSCSHNKPKAQTTSLEMSNSSF